MTKKTFKAKLKKIFETQEEAAKAESNPKLSELDAAFAIKELQMNDKE